MEISIIIPVYNKRDYLEECVKSILSQSFAYFELILVDDGSTDGSSDLCDHLLGSDNRIKVYHKQNGGATSARKFGVEKATGKWIMFVDADDTMHDGAISDLICHDDGVSDMIAGTILYKSLQKLIKTGTKSLSISNTEYIHLLLNRQTYFGPCSKLIKKSLFDKIEWNEDKRVFQNEDLLMLIKLASKCECHISVSNECVHYICVDKPGSMSTKVMSYEGWKILLFDLENTIVRSFGNSGKLCNDFINYSIWALYEHLLIKGKYIPQDSYLSQLVQRACKTDIYEGNIKALGLLSSPLKRTVFCIYRRCRLGMKHIKNLRKY